MYNFFSKILKHKKALSFTLLFFVLIGFIIPQVAYASFPCYILGFFGGLGALANIGCTAAPAATKAVVDHTIAPIVGGTVFAIAIVMIGIFGTLSNLAGGLLLYIIGLNADPAWSFTHFTNPVIAIGWTAVRDLANMVIVLGFVIIGIATALRFREYEAKKLLPKLIIAALLVNFSLLICGIFIDGSNIVTTAFLKGGGFLEQSVGEMLSIQVTKLYDSTDLWDISKMPELVGAATAIVFFDIITLVIFFLYFFLFLFRYIFLWILVILSPLAFVFYVFPFTKKFFDMWWNNFFQWCTIGITGAFFLNLADLLTKGLTDKAITTISSTNPNPVAQNMMSYLVPCAFLLGGILFSMKSGAIGASIAVSASKMAGRGAGKVGGFVAGATGASKAANALKTGAIRAGEKMRLVAPGTADTLEGKRLEEPKKRLASQTSQQLAKIATQSGGTKKGSEDKAAAATILAERKDLHEIKDENARAQAIAHATSFPGVKRSDFEKSDYRMKESNTKAVEQYRTAHSGTSELAAKKALRFEQLEQNLSSMSPEQRKNIDVADISQDLLLSDKFNGGVVRDFRTADRARRKRIKALCATGGPIHTAAAAAYAAGNTAEGNRLSTIMTEATRLAR